MKNWPCKPFLWLSVVAAFLVACGGTSTMITPPPPPKPTITSVSIAATSDAVTAGQTDMVTPTVLGTGSFTNTVDLTVSPTTAGALSASTNVASATQVTFTSSNAIGVATSVVITATSTEDSTKFKSTTITVNPVPLPVVSITAKPASVVLGQTTTIAWNMTGAMTSSSVSGPGLTTSSSPTGSAAATPTAVGTATYTATATNASGSTTLTATVTVTAPAAPTGSLTPSATSVVAGKSLTLTLATKNAQTCTASSTDDSWSGTVNCNGVYTVTPTATSGTVTYSVDVTGAGGSITLSSNPITITAAPIVVTSVTPGTLWCVSQCGFPKITLNGSGFADGQLPVITPATQILQTQLISPTEMQITLVIDQDDEGSGNRSIKVCDADGVTNCSASVKLGLYSSNITGIDESSGEKFSLGSSSVYKTDANGNPDGSFPDDDPAATSISFDPVTKLVTVDGGVYDEKGGFLDTPSFDFPSGTLVASAAGLHMLCLAETKAANDVSCGDLTGSVTTTNPVISTNVGTNPQSLAIGSAGGKTRLYVLTTGGTPTLYSVDISDGQSGMANPISQTIPDFTSGVPAGSGIAISDSTVIVVSFGDKIAATFDATTLKPLGEITLPGTPISVAGENGIVLVGNADSTITSVDLNNGTASVIAGDISQWLPAGLAIDTANGTFSVCPDDASPCNNFKLP